LNPTRFHIQEIFVKSFITRRIALNPLTAFGNKSQNFKNSVDCIAAGNNVIFDTDYVCTHGHANHANADGVLRLLKSGFAGLHNLLGV
jgi:hypothetical protein